MSPFGTKNLNLQSSAQSSKQFLYSWVLLDNIPGSVKKDNDLLGIPIL